MHLANEPHVAEHIGVAGKVDRDSVLEPDHIAGGLSEVYDPPIFDRRAAVNGRHHRDRDIPNQLSATLAHRRGVLDALGLEPEAYLVVRDDVRTGGARDRGRIAGVIAMPVRDEDEIEVADLPLRLGTRWIRGDERLD